MNLPKHLKSPFKWHDRHVVIDDRVWYVPDQFDDFASFSFPGWNDPSLFGKVAPICIEYCSGNGAWIAEKARSQPEYHWLAVEKKFERVRKIWSKIKKFELANLVAVCGEGYRLTHYYLPTESVRNVFINFPDPWPKTRHAKHRIVQVPFIQEIYRILEKEGVLAMVTDDEPYSKEMIQVLQKVSGFESVFPDPFYVTEHPSYGTSYFEDLWREKGKTIFYHAFRKI